jgi:hypothetical protein
LQWKWRGLPHPYNIKKRNNNKMISSGDMKMRDEICIDKDTTVILGACIIMYLIGFVQGYFS